MLADLKLKHLKVYVLVLLLNFPFYLNLRTVVSQRLLYIRKTGWEGISHIISSEAPL